MLEFKHTYKDIPDKYTALDPFQYYHETQTTDYEDEMRKYNEEFIKVVTNIKKRHSPTTTTIATGVIELKEHWKATNSSMFPKDRELPLPTASIYI